MTWKVERPSSLMVEQACALFNSTSPRDFPEPAGAWGIDEGVWKALIALTRSKCEALHIPITKGDDLKGMCIWGSVVAAKFYVHKFALIHSHVIRVQGISDHYFVSVGGKGQTGICDITCNQFVGAPAYIAGSLEDVQGVAQKVNIKGLSLYDAYALGAQSSNFVL